MRLWRITKYDAHDDISKIQIAKFYKYIDLISAIKNAINMAKYWTRKI